MFNVLFVKKDTCGHCLPHRQIFFKTYVITFCVLNSLRFCYEIKVIILKVYENVEITCHFSNYVDKNEKKMDFKVL